MEIGKVSIQQMNMWLLLLTLINKLLIFGTHKELGLLSLLFVLVSSLLELSYYPSLGDISIVIVAKRRMKIGLLLKKTKKQRETIGQR